jgi:hypothetical protein
MNKFQKRKDELLDSFLECECSRIGTYNVVFNLLTTWHFTRNDLIKLGFETLDIDEAIKEIKKYN